MIYLASPYSHQDSAVRQARFEAACRAAAWLMRAGHLVFCPIAHSHPICEIGGMNRATEAWLGTDCVLLSACDRLVVLAIDGWRESRGVQAELRVATDLKLPIDCLEVRSRYEFTRFPAGEERPGLPPQAFCTR